MGYDAPHLSAKYSAVPTVLGCLSRMSLFEIAVYIAVFSTIAYILKKKIKKKN